MDVNINVDLVRFDVHRSPHNVWSSGRAAVEFIARQFDNASAS